MLIVNNDQSQSITRIDCVSIDNFFILGVWEHGQQIRHHNAIPNHWQSRLAGRRDDRRTTKLKQTIPKLHFL